MSKKIKIAVISANGKLGKLVVNEAIKRGMDVTAFVRSQNQTKTSKVVIKDVFEITKSDLENFDFVVNAFGVWKEDELYLFNKEIQHLCDILSETNTRLIHLGGAGSLYVDNNTMLYQTKDFPKEFYLLASQHASAFLELKKRNDVKWTVFHPAANLIFDGKKIGEYKLGNEFLQLSSNGKSEISYDDFSLAIVDEIEKGNHIHQRLSVVWK